MNGLDPSLRRRLQSELRALEHREAENVPALETFLPLRVHRMALRPEVVLVRGGRGAGKSALFNLLKDLRETRRVRDFFQDVSLPESTWLDAYSQVDPSHPSVEILDDFASKADDTQIRAFWLAHLLLRVSTRADWPPSRTKSRKIRRHCGW